jgi:hypothetical protein
LKEQPLEFFKDETKENQQSFLIQLAENTIDFIENVYPEQSSNIWHKFKQSLVIEKQLCQNNTLLFEVDDLKERHKMLHLAYKNAPNIRLKKNNIVSYTGNIQL